nr:MAG TPA: ATP-dependent DNA helicase [Caudoviricetes sp.]
MKTIFKVGDRVFDIRFGWGTVKEVLDTSCHNYPIIVFFDNIGNVITYASDGSFGAGTPQMLSFTEYTLQGFSQEKPVNYEYYIGKWGRFWDNGENAVIVGKLYDYYQYHTHHFRVRTHDDEVAFYTNFEPLTEEQIKVLGL